MKCNEIAELTVPYLELDLEPSRVRDVTAHLEGCAACRAEMEAVRQVLVRVKGVAVPDPGERFWSEFPTQVRAELRRARAESREPLRKPAVSPAWKAMSSWPVALAASVLLLVGAWSLKGLFMQDAAPVPAGRTVAQAPIKQPPRAEGAGRQSGDSAGERASAAGDRQGRPEAESRSRPRGAPADLPQELTFLVDADWHDYWEDDPDLALAEMASRLDRRTVDRLFGDI